MNSRERMLTALNGGKPDRLPATIHGWMGYWLDKYLNGADQFEAYKHFDMDAQIFYFDYHEKPVVTGMYFTHDLIPGENWKVDCEVVKDDEVSTRYEFSIKTPEGKLTKSLEQDDKMTWITEYPIKKKEQIYWIEKYMPIPRVNKEAINEVFEKMGDMGILRANIYGHQGGCWSDACNFYGTQDLIMETHDDPEWVHEFLEILLERKMKFIEDLEGTRIDLLENGGGQSSMSVISPDIFREFCIPYDQQLSEALEEIDVMTAYHTCGKMMAQLELIKETNATASETLSPEDMGGDAELEEINRVLGGDMALIGGFNQKKGFQEGDESTVRNIVKKCFKEAGSGGGYIMAASDHFFEGKPENIKAYTDIAREFTY